MISPLWEVSLRRLGPMPFIAALVGLLLVGGGRACFAEKVHTSDFEDRAKISTAWSLTNQGATPRGRRKFLGPLANDSTTLSLQNLPPHAYLRVTFDLFILRNWVGASSLSDEDTLEDRGPHYWGLKVERGPTLLHAAFANSTFQSARGQTFPCLLPGERVQAGAGAKSTGTLGYTSPGDIITTPGDIIYGMRFTFPHTADSVRLSFYGQNLEDVTEQSWGLDDVVVEVLTEAEMPALDEKTLAEAWDDLGAAEPMRAYEMAWKFVEQGDRGVKYIAQRWGASEKPAELEMMTQRVKTLVEQLDSDRFYVRQKATRQLTLLASRASPLLLNAREKATSAEVRWRLQEVLQAVDAINPASLDATTRRRLRLARVLDLIHTDAAQSLSVQMGLMTR